MKEKDFEFHGFHRHFTPDEARRHGRHGGFIGIYILHTLEKEPKSGYDIIKELSEKTGGVWSPSKGTLYPTLKNMEEDGFIRIAGTGARSKNIYEITNEGKEKLEKIIQHRKGTEERVYLFRKIFSEIVDKKCPVPAETLFEIRHTLDKITPEHEEKARDLTEKYLKELKELIPDESSNS
ncbi:DNA-binding PadR family transcriptional regulator [Methanomicrobium sp. W14]|uniref:PadR family transcriptional regulator n=1 Tax=Methanomicrobium sp. W14 TaxID=2817839 RepID=UPI001AEA3611|nr:PadR family transcriptional regulator [Methanomicrobium sp. W14]MBP2133284.1 DNA-binding PadR family transcriptional regulator [Methanomicrobium sp. W14]